MLWRYIKLLKFIFFITIIPLEYKAMLRKPLEPDMDLANLNAFIAVAEMGSFSQAAERLHLTQPAVSKRMASPLESQLKVRLFDRWAAKSA
jgi:hypothetical protein